MRSFSLLWQDHEACAGRIRTCLELFLDDLKIPKTNKKANGRSVPLTLHGRIEAYGKLDEEAAKLLLAVKWIENVGSHSQLEALTREDLLDVFEILEYVIEENYTGRKKRLTAIATAINNAKGKPPKVKK